MHRLACMHAYLCVCLGYWALCCSPRGLCAVPRELARFRPWAGALSVFLFLSSVPFFSFSPNTISVAAPIPLHVRACAGLCTRPSRLTARRGGAWSMHARCRAGWESVRADGTIDSDGRHDVLQHRLPAATGSPSLLRVCAMERCEAGCTCGRSSADVRHTVTRAVTFICVRCLPRRRHSERHNSTCALKQYENTP